MIILLYVTGFIVLYAILWFIVERMWHPWLESRSDNQMSQKWLYEQRRNNGEES